MRKLALGVRGKIPGWTTLDADPNSGSDIIATLPHLPPAADGPWDVIEWIHGIGYVYRWEAVPLLRELHARLAAGGTLILEQPNLLICIQQVIMKGIYGDPEHRDPLHMYKWGWTPQTLSAAVHEAGFIRLWHKPAEHHVPARDFRIEAVK